MTGLYIHIPFCARKCPYCDFCSTAFNKTLVQNYVDAVVRNIAHYSTDRIGLDTIYFGGGTPSLLTPQQVGQILHCAENSFVLHSPEITLEANPCTVSLSKLSEYRSLGVNRLSFGIQSASDSELVSLGRLHTFGRAEKAVNDAFDAGFDNISCDLMIGIPDQTIQSLEYSIDALTNLPVQHISAYMLKIEQGTPFDSDKIRNTVADDDLSSEMYLTTVQKLAAAGFEQYEISNFAKPGFESRHNMKYWIGESYIGIGASAHSLFDGKRYFCPGDIGRFASSPLQQTVSEDDDPDKLEEYVMLGLRLTKGISLSKLAELGASDLSGLIAKAAAYERNDLCVLKDGVLRLTPKGFLVSNVLISEFIQIL